MPRELRVKKRDYLSSSFVVAVSHLEEMWCWVAMTKGSACTQEDLVARDAESISRRAGERIPGRRFGHGSPQRCQNSLLLKSNHQGLGPALTQHSAHSKLKHHLWVWVQSSIMSYLESWRVASLATVGLVDLRTYVRTAAVWMNTSFVSWRARSAQSHFRTEAIVHSLDYER